jgi:hypothetical protein
MDQASMKDVPKNMRLTGMLLFRDALMEALEGEKLMCVVHAAHAAETLLKARIAQEHPLLIFSKLPKADSNKSTLTWIDLLESGRTLSYEELPDQLWATTDIKIERVQLQRYREFGKLRNQIVHLSRANAERLDVLTICYLLEVLDPLVEGFWGRSVIDFITKDPDVRYDNLVGSGLFEDAIRKTLVIDERLRRLLGDASKAAWEKRNAHFEEMERLDRAKTAKDWEAEYETLLESQSDCPDDEHYKQLAEDEAKWNSFLDSF